jgi:hypothetical protein
MADPKCRSLDLSSYLLEPMQRITRYPLLIKQILHYTPKPHPDHADLLIALSLTEKVLSEVNTAAKKAENQAKMEEISDLVDVEALSGQGAKLELNSMTRQLGRRELVHEGPLFKAKSGRKLYAYLFNDLILLCEPHRAARPSDSARQAYTVYRQPLPLNETIVRETPNTNRSFTSLVDMTSDLTFQLVHIEQIIVLRAPDKKSRNIWIQKIEAAYSNCVAVEKEQRRQGSIIICRLKRAVSMQRVVGGDQCMGTLNVLVVECKNLWLSDPSALRSDIYCHVQLGKQQLKTRTVPVVPNRMNQQSAVVDVRFGQALMFSVPNLDTVLRFVVFCCDKYSQDGILFIKKHR